MLKVIEGTKKAKPNMELLWLVALQKALIQSDTKKIVMAGVKYIGASISSKDKTDMEQVQGRFDLINCIQMFMAQLTPREFMQLFPIEKTYDGDKWGCKDYFYTMKYIQKMDVDKPIGGERHLFDFLWEYQNWDINEFLVECMTSMDGVCHLQGQPGPMDKLIDELGVTPYYMEKDEATGQQYLLNSDTGKTVPIKKPVPRYLKLVQ